MHIEHDLPKAIHQLRKQITVLTQIVLENRRLTVNTWRSEMSVLTDLQAQVAATQAGEASAIVLLNGLKAKLDAAGTDPAALQALSDSLASSAAGLAAAVATDGADPAPAPSPAPAPAPAPTDGTGTGT